MFGIDMKIFSMNLELVQILVSMAELLVILDPFRSFW